MGRILGIAGTAKNTGKTTTLQAVVRYLRQNGVGVFLTSIGYDGEDIDTVTGLPKPKVIVEEGDMVASARPLLEASPARFSRMKATGIDCALGPIYQGVATAPGKVVLAGPVSTKDVAAICKGAPPGRVILLDGAFSRLAPMVLADSLILATGAARSPDAWRIAAEMEALSVVFGLPERDVSHAGVEPAARAKDSLPSDADFLRFPEGLFVEGQDTTIAARVAAALGVRPLLDRPGREGAASSQRVTVSIDGVVNPSVFSSMLDKVRAAVFPETGRGNPGDSGIEFVLGHPVFMLLSGVVNEWVKALERAHSFGFRVSVEKKSNLLGFTVNPFRPEFDPIRNAYTARYVDAAAYLHEIRNLTKAPCTDTVYEGPGTLESWLTASGLLAGDLRESVS